MRCFPLFIVVHLLFFQTAVIAQAENPPKSEPQCLVLEKSDFSRELTRDGVFIPAEFEEIRIWPEEYKGELLIMEVLPHGTPVNKGDIIANVKMKGFERQLEQAKKQVEAAELKLQSARQRAEIDDVSAMTALEEKQLDLDLSRKMLVGWEKHELEFSRRSAELSRQATDNYIEDQQDELAQLEAMYRDDELVDATEEVVLKRSRRGLAQANASRDLQKDRRTYHVAFNEVEQTTRKRRAVQTKEIALAQLLKRQEIDRRLREDGLAQAERALEKARESFENLTGDAETLTFKAGRSGYLLHGSKNDYLPGSVPPRYKKGSRLSMNSTAFLVAEPDRVDMAIDIPESSIQEYQTGSAVTVEPTCSSKIKPIGILHVKRFPSAKSAAAPENKYEALIKIEDRLPGIVPGMRAKARLTAEKLNQVFVLPNSAIFGGAETPHCWAAEPGSTEFKRMTVEKGPGSGSETVVYGAFEEGWKVLLGAGK